MSTCSLHNLIRLAGIVITGLSLIMLAWQSSDRMQELYAHETPFNYVMEFALDLYLVNENLLYWIMAAVPLLYSWFAVLVHYGRLKMKPNDWKQKLLSLCGSSMLTTVIVYHVRDEPIFVLIYVPY